MQLIFFQNCISPHQLPYILELSMLQCVEKIIIISPRVNYDFRSDMGWDANELLSYKEIEFLIAPTDDQVKALLNGCTLESCHCIFSGINAFCEVAGWLKLSLKFDVNRSIITEPPFVYKRPVWMHGCRFLLKDFKYIKYINNIYVIGENYLWYYRMWSKKWNVIPFIYCTKSIERKIPVQNDKNLKILYVGSLSKRKNVQLLLKAAKDIDSIEIGLIGNGEQRSTLEALSGKNVIFYGSQSMNLVSEYMQRYDVLVLPSFYDGWGAVVNEALTLGLYVICSNRCGAQSLLKEKEQGLVFKSNDEKSLRDALLQCKNNIRQIRNNVSNRIEWSSSNISGKAVAKYFMNNL
jgi:Glycosyltransferase